MGSDQSGGMLCPFMATACFDLSMGFCSLHLTPISQEMFKISTPKLGFEKKYTCKISPTSLNHSINVYA